IVGRRGVYDEGGMVEGRVERAMKGVQTLHRLKQERRSHTPYLIINSAITGRNYEGTLQMIDVARSFGAFAINFQHFWFLTRGMVENHNSLYGDCFPLDFDHVGGTETTGVDTEL